MSREQLMSMLQRQVNQGGCGDGLSGGAMTGGLFTPAARVGLSEYQHFRAQHPGLSRAELSAMWHRHKTGGALVGGFPGQRKIFAEMKANLAKVSEFPNAKAFKAALAANRKQLAAQYELAHPDWKPKKSVPRGSKASQALLKQIRMAALARPDCESLRRAPAGHTAAELARLAAHLGITPPGRSAEYYKEIELAKRAKEARKAAKQLAKLAAAEEAASAAMSNPDLDQILYDLYSGKHSE